jgi:hypothetical protein
MDWSSQGMARSASFTAIASAPTTHTCPASARPRSSSQQRRSRVNAALGDVTQPVNAGATGPGVHGFPAWRSSWAASPSIRTTALQHEVQAMAQRLMSRQGSADSPQRMLTTGSTCAPKLAAGPQPQHLSLKRSPDATERPRTLLAQQVSPELDHFDSSAAVAPQEKLPVRVRPKPEPRCWTIADMTQASPERALVQSEELTAPSLAAEISLKALCIGSRKAGDLNSCQTGVVQQRAEGVAVVNAPLPAAAAQPIWTRNPSMTKRPSSVEGANHEQQVDEPGLGTTHSTDGVNGANLLTMSEQA